MLMPTPLAKIDDRTLLVRGQKAMTDADPAQRQGMPTNSLHQAVKRDAQRFSPDFVFIPSTQEKAELVANCDLLGKLKFSKTLPFALTECCAMRNPCRH